MSFLLLLHFIITVAAQDGLLQLDKSYYFAGDPIFYTLCLDHVKSDSIVIKATFSQGNSPLIDHHHVLASGWCTGHFKLSHELATGIYEIHFHAFDKASGNPIRLAVAPVSIFGDLSPTDQPQQIVIPGPIPQSLENRSLSISLPNNKLGRREQIKGTIESLGSLAKRLSICIHQRSKGHDLPPFHHFVHDLHERECLMQIPVNGLRRLLNVEQSRNLLLHGVVAQNLQFDLTQVDREGRFTMEFSQIYGEQIVQFIDFLGLPMELQSTSPIIAGKRIQYDFVEADIERAYSLFQKRRDINRLFNRVGLPLESMALSTPGQVTDPDFDIDVQNYEVRGIVVDLFKEILTSLKFRKKKDQYRARVLFGTTGNQHFHEVPALFLVNGLATQDQDFVAKLPLQEVKRIRIYSQVSTLRKLVGGRTTGGVIIIDLIDPFYQIPHELTLPSMAIKGLQKPLRFPIGFDLNAKAPQIKSLVYWAPSNQMDESGHYQFEFVTSDLAGEYIIEVVAKDQTGDISIVSKNIYVE